MKWLKRIFYFLVTLLLIASVALVGTGNSHLFKAVANTYLVGQTGPSIDEHHIFSSRKVAIGSPQPWYQSKVYNKHLPSEQLLSKMEVYDPIALLIIRKDSLIYEKYWNDYNQSSLTNSFSMAKTFVGILVGIAISEGKIQGLDQKVGDFLPQYQNGKNSELTIRHLLSMSSGINFDESYGDPFGFMAKAYYGDELEKKTFEYKVIQTPGTEWSYLGGNTILLSLILEKVTGMSLSQYCSEKLWQPLGAEHPALWSLDDEDGIEKAYCCFYSNARDFAKIGQLYLHKGNWNGLQLVPEDYVNISTNKVMCNNETIEHYGLHWWIGEHKGHPFYYARGILGQYIIVVPDLEMTIVRLGHKRGEKLPSNHPVDVFQYLDFAMELSEKLK